MTKQQKGIQWVRGEWANRNWDTYSAHPFGKANCLATDDLLRKLNPITPIDPEGYVGYWMVPNFAYQWQLYSVVVSTPQEFGESTAGWFVELNPLLHLKYTPNTLVVDAVMKQLFRLRAGQTYAIRIESHSEVGTARKPYGPLQYRFRKTKRW
jgi:hypothetical protein